jgi:hypothetical protein
MSMKSFVNEVVGRAVKKNGVDAEWVLDQRAVLSAIISRGALDKGELTVQEAVELAALGADAAAESRTRRGGVKREDPVEILSRAAAQSPEIERFIAAIVEAASRGAARGEAASKRKRTKKE